MRLNFFFALASYGSPWRSRKRGGKEQHPRGGDVLLNIGDLLNSACGDCVNSIRTESGGAPIRFLLTAVHTTKPAETLNKFFHSVHQNMQIPFQIGT